MADQDTILKTKADVLRWLTSNGWDIGKTQFYAHCREGLLRPQKNGGNYTVKSVKKYADLHVRRVETGVKETTRQEQMRDEKLELSLQRERIAKDRDQFELDRKKGQFIPTEDFEAAIVARAVALMAHLTHTIQTEVPNWIDVVEGKQDCAPDLVEAMTKKVEERIGDFAANAEITVIFEAT